jgi:hypothetical protein
MGDPLVSIVTPVINRAGAIRALADAPFIYDVLIGRESK